VKISAGAILEDCTRVTFYTNTTTTTTNAALDVRDFNWLRSGVPSPNYSIQQESESDEASFRMQSFPDRNDLLKEEVPNERSNDAVSTSILSKAQLAVQNAKQEEDNDDDDDDDDDDDEL
jgi:hypothetical protein